MEPASEPVGAVPRWRRAVLFAVIALQIAIPTVMLVLRLTGDGAPMRFGWHMFSGIP